MVWYLHLKIILNKEINVITQEQLKLAGYKPFTQNGLSAYTNSYWQKRFVDEKGKKYFITIAEYDNSSYKELFELRGKYSFQPEAQFESHGVTFNIQMLSPESIEEMEAFFEKMWYNMNCNYYEEF